VKSLGVATQLLVDSVLARTFARVRNRELCGSNGAASLGAQLKCLYANARSMGNKQEKLQICAHLWACEITGITEMWWDSSYNWIIGMGGYRLFRKDRQGRRGGGVTLYVKEQLECMELRLGMDEEPTENLWVKIKGRAGASDTTVGVCYRTPDQDEGADEALYRQIGEVSRSKALVLMQPPQHLLKGKHSRAQASQEVPGMR